MFKSFFKLLSVRELDIEMSDSLKDRAEERNYLHQFILFEDVSSHIALCKLAVVLKLLLSHRESQS